MAAVGFAEIFLGVMAVAGVTLLAWVGWNAYVAISEWLKWRKVK